MITHVIVEEVIIGKKPLLKRLIDFLLRRKTRFSMPCLRFVSKDGKYKLPLIDLEQGLVFPVIELSCPIDERYYVPQIINPNDYPVIVKLRFICRKYVT